jgi:hypothetical protein
MRSAGPDHRSEHGHSLLWVTNLVAMAPPARPKIGGRAIRVAAVAVSVVCCIVLSGCAGSTHGVNLGGRWTSSDYTCPVGVRHLETVEIEQRGSQLTATKVIGDQCIPGGHVTFTGELSGDSGLVAFWAAQAGGVPMLGPRTQPLRVTGRNQFTAQFAGVGAMTFTRVPAIDRTEWGWILALAFDLLIVVAVLAYRRRLRPWARRRRTTTWRNG